METHERARCETMSELSLMLVVAQAMGRRLANETHGRHHGAVRDLNELLHMARQRLGAIQAEACGTITDAIVAREFAETDAAARHHS